MKLFWISQIRDWGRSQETTRFLLILFPLFVLLALGMTGCDVGPQLPKARNEVEARGRHVLQIAEGCGCHGANFAGWRHGRSDRLPQSRPYGERFIGPFGSLPASNITPDMDTGIGSWSDAQILAALQEGVRPDGTYLYPLMPSAAYHGLTDEDARAIVAFLRRLRPLRNLVPDRQLTMTVSKQENGMDAPKRRPEGGVELGAYLVHSVSGCADCHTTPAENGRPRGALLAGRILETASERIVVPNITPDPRNGIGQWRTRDIAHYLRTGSRPDGGLAHSLMAGLILTSFSHLTSQEADAIAAYLKSVPSVH
jgi:mono/diheme cytochrome c family protein